MVKTNSRANNRNGTKIKTWETKIESITVNDRRLRLDLLHDAYVCCMHRDKCTNTMVHEKLDRNRLQTL